MRQRRLTVLLLALLVAVAVTAAGCGKSEENSTTTPGATEMTDNTASDAGAGAGATEVRVTLSDFKIEPATITVPQGAQVTLVVENVSTANPHDLHIPDLNVATKQLATGESETITFTADQAGEHHMLCTVPGHEALGMSATLVVQ
ncbi:MAG TPA: cupredoxin domain-containing protein [Limnochordia bacterium]